MKKNIFIWIAFASLAVGMIACAPINRSGCPTHDKNYFRQK